MTRKYMTIKDHTGAVLFEGVDQPAFKPSHSSLILYYAVCAAVFLAGVLFISYIANMGA